MKVLITDEISQEGLQSMARKNALIVIPEGTGELKEKTMIAVQLLGSTAGLNS